jgi:SSS family solute:Na+ symporter
MDRMTLVFIILMALMVVISLADRRSKGNPRVVEIDTSMFRCSPGFIVGSTVIIGILAALYTLFY